MSGVSGAAGAAPGEAQGYTETTEMMGKALVVSFGVVAGLYMLSTVLAYTPLSPIYYSQFDWVELNGPWVLTHYGSDDDSCLGHRTGASWNGVSAPDWTQPGVWMPDTVTLDHSCVAMPGPEFYGLPVAVCVGGMCVMATAVDVPDNYRLKIDDVYYMHADLCNKPAKELSLVGSGVITGAKVFIGRYTGGSDPWD